MKGQKNDGCFSIGFREFLDRTKLDEKKISEACGVSVPLVYNWGNGRNIPTYYSLKSLFGLGMHPEEMFGSAIFSDDSERVEFENNQNQKSVSELKLIFHTSYKRLAIYQIQRGLQNSFNSMTKQEKIEFMLKAIDEELAVLNEINSCMKEISKK